MAATAADDIWAMDLVHDRLFDGKKIRVLTIVDTLSRVSPGADVRRSYRGSDVADTLERAGARLWFLPSYSPDLNHIDQTFAKIKHWMRAAQARTIPDTWRHIGRFVEAIEPAECANYFANAGYASVKT